ENRTCWRRSGVIVTEDIRTSNLPACRAGISPSHCTTIHSHRRCRRLHISSPKSMSKPCTFPSGPTALKGAYAPSTPMRRGGSSARAVPPASRMDRAAKSAVFIGPSRMAGAFSVLGAFHVGTVGGHHHDAGADGDVRRHGRLDAV